MRSYGLLPWGPAPRLPVGIASLGPAPQTPLISLRELKTKRCYLLITALQPYEGFEGPSEARPGWVWGASPQVSSIIRRVKVKLTYDILLGRSSHYLYHLLFSLTRQGHWRSLNQRSGGRRRRRQMKAGRVMDGEWRCVTLDGLPRYHSV
jgi:hypothetical protein